MNRPVIKIKGQKGLLLVLTVGRNGSNMKLSVFNEDNEAGAFACAGVQGDDISAVIAEDVTFEIEDRTSEGKK